MQTKKQKISKIGHAKSDTVSDENLKLSKHRMCIFLCVTLQR